VLLVALIPAGLRAFREDGGRRTASLAGLSMLLLSFGLTVSIQLSAWSIQFGSALLIPQGGGYLHWARPHLFPFLLSTQNGVIPWTPGLALGLGGLFLRGRSGDAYAERLRLGCCAAALLAIYACASVADWWGGISYGPRRLTSLTPLAALGLGLLLERLGARTRALLCAALVAWALVLAGVYVSGFDDLSAALLGRPGPWNATPAAYAGLRMDWADLWSFVTRGFTLRDRAGHLERALGAAALLAVLGALGWAWRVLQGNARLQRLALAMVGAWVAAAALLLPATVPSNEAPNAQWRTVACGGWRAASLPPLPKGTQDAAGVVLATHALYEGRREDFESWMRRVDGRQAPGSTREAVLAFLDEPEGRRLVAEVRRCPTAP
jgi:hypothetical protein